MSDHHAPIPRRRFLGGLAIAGASLAIPHSPLLASSTPADLAVLDGPDDWDHSWLNKLSTKHRTFFENKTMGGDTLQYPKRYYDAMLDGYGAAAKDVTVVIGFAGTGWPVAINDEKWAAWGLKQSANAPSGPGSNPAKADITLWKSRGAILLVCNNALKRGSTEIAATMPNGDAAKIYTEMRAAILPEFTVVPALVAALAMAQEKDCAYLVGS